MSARRYTLILLVFVLVLLVWMTVAAAVLTPYRSSLLRKAGALVAPALTPSPTPFRPVANQPTQVVAQVAAPDGPQHTPQVLSLRPTPSAVPELQSMQFYGINFSDREKRVRITIFPPDKRVNQGKPIVIAFVPGENCEFGNQLACVNSFLSGADAQVTFLTIHSGIGGQAETFRSAVEGTGFNQPAYALSKVQTNIESLQGAQVEIKQGETIISNLVLRVIARIPSTGVHEYVRSPAEQALNLASKIDPEILTQVDLKQPQLVFETCGWKMPEEPWAKNVTLTSGSIYLVVIQQSQPSKTDPEP